MGYAPRQPDGYRIAICFFYELLGYDADSCTVSPAPSPPPLPLYPDGRDQITMVPLDHAAACLLLPHLASSCEQLEKGSNDGWLLPVGISHDGWFPVQSSPGFSFAALVIMKVSIFLTMFSSMLLMMQKVTSGRRRRHPFLLAPSPRLATTANNSTTPGAAGYSRLLP
jgi:hypothetical protein